MSTTVGSGSFLDVLKYYNTHAAPGNKTQYIKENGADAETLKETLRSLGFDQPKLSDAVEAFQRRYNAEHADTPITVDGKAGANTLEALYSTADTLRQNSGADTAKFLDAKSQITPFVGPPRPDSMKVTSHDPKTIKEQLNQKLDQNQAKATGAKDTKANADAPARDLTTIEAEIAAKKADIKALGGSADVASEHLRREKIKGLKAEQEKLESSPEFQAIKGLRADQAKLKGLEEDRMFLPSGKDIEERTGAIKTLRDSIATQEKTVAPYKARVEGEEARIKGDLSGLQDRYGSDQARHHFDKTIESLKKDVGTLEAELKGHPGYQDLIQYRDAKANLAKLRDDTMFMPTGADIEQRMKAIENAEDIVKRYEAGKTAPQPAKEPAREAPATPVTITA